MGKIIITAFSVVALIFVSACTTKRKELLNKVDPAAYAARTDYEGKTFHLVRSIQDADTNNDVWAVPGFSQDFGLVTTRITESEIQFISAFDPLNRAETMSIVAAYPITSHFDIVREENDYKEKTNRIIEEKVKPWKQRAFMRVDWAKPSIQVSKLKMQLGEERLEEEGVTLLESPSKDKNGNISWLTETSIRGANPYKWTKRLFTPGDIGAKASFRVTYRTQLLPAHSSDFQPVSYSIKDFSRFGYFTTQQTVEDPYKGFLDQNVKNFAEVYNVCQPGTNRSCSTNKIVWYLNKGFPKVYLNAAKTAVDAWNQAFQKALGRNDQVIELNLSRDVEFTDTSVNVIGLYDPSYSSIGLLGVAQSVVDPRTGEKVSSRATVYDGGIRSMVDRADEIINLLTSDDPMAKVIGSPAMGLKSDLVDGFDLANEKSKAENLRRALHLKNSSTGASIQAAQTLVQQLNASAPSASARRNAFFESPRAATAIAIPELTALAEITGGPLTAGSLFSKTEEKANPTFQGLDRLMHIGEQIRADKTHFLRQSGLGIHGSDMVEEAAERFILRYYAKGDKAGLKANREKIKARVAELVFFKTLLHEMGHAFGLRHNFQASADRKHYTENYGKVLARIEAGDKTFSKADLDPYSYSSIMDYGSDFYAGAGSLGPYDVAAIRYAYNRSINRETDEATTKQNFYFCTDHQVGETVLCQRHDRGANVSQIITNTIDRYQRTYFLEHFRRDRADFEDRARSYLGWTLQKTMIPVRRVMDELFWMLVIGSQNFQGANGNCGMRFMDASIQRGEIANVCDTRAAVNASADPEDMSTWFRALRSDKVTPENYMPYGLADLVVANEIAKNFFLSVLGSAEPGSYLVYQRKPGEMPGMKRLPGEGEDIESKLRQFAQSIGVDEAKMPAFMKEARELTVTIPVGVFGKPFYMSSSYEAGIRKLNSIGSIYDKIGALLALSLRDIGISKFRDIKSAGARGTLAGNPYVFPHTKSFVNALFGNLIVDEPFLPIPVTFHSGSVAGRTVPVVLPSATNNDIQSIATILTMTEMVFPFDQSMLSKLKICTVEDQGCLARTEQNQQANVKFRSTDYSTEYRTFQTVDGDSIAYALIAKAKEIDDARLKLEKGQRPEIETREEAMKKLAEAEPIRLRLAEGIQKIQDLADLNTIIGKTGDASDWSKMQILTDRAASLSPSAVAGVSIQIVDNLKRASLRVDEKLAANPVDPTVRQTLEALSSDFHAAVEIFDKTSEQNFTGRGTKKAIGKASENLSLIEAKIRLIRSITKVLGD